MARSDDLLDALERNRQDVLDLFEKRSEITQKLLDITKECRSDADFFSRLDEVNSLTEQQREVGERYQRFAEEKRNIESELRLLKVPGPWDGSK
jgi:chromosome segregation ATPase